MQQTQQRNPTQYFTNRQKHFQRRADAELSNIKMFESKIMDLRRQIAGHEDEPGAKWFVDRIAYYEGEKRKAEKEMHKALYHVGRR